MKFTVLRSDLGAILLSARNGRLSGLDLFAAPADAYRWAGASMPEAEEDQSQFDPLRQLLTRYFDGEPVDFPVPVDLSAMTPFTRRVLEETRKVPYGKVAHYGSIAARLGVPAGARAVGQALGRNPIPLVIPCHRIVAADGSLGGFSMGLDIKARLLSIEGVKAHGLYGSMTVS